MAIKIDEQDLARKARILLWDCETMPNIAAVWGKYEQDVLWYESESYMFCFAYKWFGEARTHVVGLPDFKGYYKSPRNDKPLIEALYALFEQADIIIAHNGDSFDQKVANGRFLIHGLTPPAPYKQVDTLKISRRNFKLNSNKLDDLGRVLGVGRKQPTGGVELWHDVYNHDKKAIKKMLSYNIQDVKLLERVYLKLRPWATGHPSLSLIENRINACPTCASGPVVRCGLYFTKVNKVVNYRCNNCGAYAKQRMSIKSSVHYVN